MSSPKYRIKSTLNGVAVGTCMLTLYFPFLVLSESWIYMVGTFATCPKVSHDGIDYWVALVSK
jgi:hypothetical protein